LHYPKRVAINGEEFTMKRSWRRSMSWALGLFFVLSVTAFGQQSLRGSIAGTVKDDTGASLPGVTVTVTSPALQVPQIVRLSDERGEYQVLDLSPGTYRVTYELSGFATLVREGIVLTTGFNARVDPVLKVATLAETVTVTGETPLVDVTSTRGGTTISKDLIDAVPGNSNFSDVMLLAGGTSVSGPPLTGIITAGGGGFAGKTYGAGNSATGNGSVAIDGVKIMQNEIPDFTAFEEVDVKTFGNTADVDTPGAAVQLVIKSGGNQFHGRYNEIVQNHRFQANNVDAALRAQGINTGNAVLYYNDFAGDLGGRIIRNKLWFYGAARDFRNQVTILGYSKAPGPDGVYDTADDVPGTPKNLHHSFTAKISYQPTANHRFIGYTQYNPDWSLEKNAARFIPFETTLWQPQYSWDSKPIQWQGTLNNRLLADMTWGWGRYNATYKYNGGWVPNSGVPNRFNRATGQNTGASFSEGAARRIPTRQQWVGSVSYLPGHSFLGTHELNVGYRLWWGFLDYKNPDFPDQVGIGEYRLVYDAVTPGKTVDMFNGGLAQPVEMDVINFPVQGVFRENEYAGYAQDTWRPTKRLTMNLGLRWERQRHFVPPQTKAQGTFGFSGTFPQVEAGSWNRFAPRVGVAFDVSGDGKTVAKATWGRFNDDLGLREYPVTFSQNQPLQYNYRWSDPTNCNCYAPGTVNLDVNGPDFLSVAAVSGFGTLGAANNTVNPNLKLPHTNEATASIERELGRGLSVRGLYVYKKLYDLITNVNTLRPYSVYDQVFTRRDPGPDGVLGTADDGQLFTMYDYNPAYRGNAFVGSMNENRPANRDDTFKNVEVMLTKRATGKWFANTSILATKNHRFLIGVVQSFNDLINSVDNTWDVSYRLAGGYNLPYGINISTLYQAYTGISRQRTNLFRAADPAGGPSFPSSATITFRMEPFGTVRAPARNIVNLRGDKEFKLGGGRKLTMGVDAFNAFNTNVAWGGGSNGSGITDASGPTYGYVVGIVTPRVLRFSIGYQF
jgi:carboxypeptidase family protein/TonB-dependent receptor-like protein